VGKGPGEIREEIEQTREEMGDTVEALGYKADVKARAKEKITGKRDQLKERVTRTGSRAGDATPDGEQIKQGAKQAAGIAQENPLGLALGSVAVGFVAGLLVPSTRIEHEKIGPMADQVKARAKETGQEALEHGKEVAQDAAQSVKETAQQSGQQHAEDLRGSVQEKGQQVKEDVRQNAPGSTGQ
jgi:gas vesicle protein